MDNILIVSIFLTYSLKSISWKEGISFESAAQNFLPPGSRFIYNLMTCIAPGMKPYRTSLCSGMNFMAEIYVSQVLVL